MKKVIFIALLFLGIGSAKSQEMTLTSTNGVNIVTIDSKTYAVPDMSKMPWFGEEKLGAINLDTIKVTLVMAQIRNSAGEFANFQIMGKKGYFIASKNIFLDEKKKPINNLHYVFTTLPPLPNW